MHLPQMSETKQAEIRDQLPLSGSGKIITTVEPKFIPKEAVPHHSRSTEQKVKSPPDRLCGISGKRCSRAIWRTGKERMVKTPWSEKAIPFRMKPHSIGTQKVIQEHSTIGTGDHY